jgi:hypothetical protein
LAIQARFRAEGEPEMINRPSMLWNTISIRRSS